MASEYSVARELLENAIKDSDDQQVCVPCPSCVDCTLENQPPRIRAGFSMIPAAIQSNDLGTFGVDKTIFRCRPESTESYVTDQMVEDRTLRMSFAANSERNLVGS